MMKCGWLLLLLLLGGVSAWADDAGVTTERVHTADGTFTVYYRTPALEEDLGVPLPAHGVVGASFVYCVRDRKERDLLHLARVEITTPQSAAELQQYYLTALGATAQQETDAKTGEITITAGVRDHARLVTITPKAAGCALRLEQVQQFSIPPRIYTHEEKQVIALLNAVAASYQTADTVSYTVTQRTTLPVKTPATAQPSLLTWTLSLRRPTDLHVTAAVEDAVGLEITSEKDALLVHRQRGKDETRPLNKSVTIEDVPELAEDPVARMLFGNSLIDDRVEQISMSAGAENHKGEMTVVLSYPDDNAVATLRIDRKKKVVLACTTVVTEEEQVTTTTRTYSNLVLIQAAKTPAANHERGGN
jgi:hypothetical protein